MWKPGLLFLSLLVGCLGTALSREQDTSSYFDDEISSRIHGGTESDPVPHMVALTVGDQAKAFICGASLITNRYVLTAAHCVDSVLVLRVLHRSLQGIVGTNHYNSGGTSYTFSRYITHPGWNPRILKNDISILVTSKTVTLNKAVQTVALNFNFIPANVATVVHGWGRYLKGQPQVSSSLLELRTYTLGGDKCVGRFPQNAMNPQLEICTDIGKNYGLCRGDSGSALLLENSRQQIGIVSWGPIDCGNGIPDVYVRLSAYQSWFKQVVPL